MSRGRSFHRASQFYLLFCLGWNAPVLAATYYVDCISKVSAGKGSIQEPLTTVADVNALLLQPDDRLLFKRGSTCKGELKPQGSGSEASPIRIGAYAEGALPRIEAGANDEAALRLFNQSFWEIGSLDLKGGTTYGLFVGGDAASLHHLYLRDLLVHDVRGPLKHKESGLVVIRSAGERISFDDVRLDGILAYNTTQWSGIFISGASHVRVRNSTVHDVQGDGIVVFQSRDAVIERSAAWHTGMQHQITIGTPNAIWTWRCADCTVQDNEAFLTDSPGVDGGSFDIDFGNTRNTVQRNFGHDTVGYCISVFGAFGATTQSIIADNLCLDNGMSPRLAQRQGAILLMTWQGGTIDGVEVRGNRVEWRAAGDIPAIQSGEGLQAAEVALQDNEVSSTGLSFVDSKLSYKGKHNKYKLLSAEPSDRAAALPAFSALPEEGSTLTGVPGGIATAFDLRPTNTPGWRLELTAPSSSLPGLDNDDLRGVLEALRSAASQFGHAGLRVEIVADAAVATLAQDWSLPSHGIVLKAPPAGKNSGMLLRLFSPQGKVVREWRTYCSPVDLGLALRQNVGPPNFGHLTFEGVRATD